MTVVEQSWTGARNDRMMTNRIQQGMARRLGGLFLAGMFVVGCAKDAPPPPDATPPAPIAWAFDAPPAWDDRVTLVENPQPGSFLSSRVFVLAPRDTTVRPQVLLGIVVYDSATWARVAAEPGPPQGDSLLSVAGQVFVAGLPQSNPFADGSPDFFTFDSLAVALDRVRQGFRVLR